MLTLDLAQRLKAVGLAWHPTSGDRFVVPVTDMEEDVFVLSEVTADVHRFSGGDVIGFNGTTEWALDSIEQDAVVWLPREEQLRDLLGDSFLRLEPVAGGYAVTTTHPQHGERRFVDLDAERAYGRALLSHLGEADH